MGKQKHLLGADNGSYVATLTVTDDQGQSDTKVQQVAVINKGPEVDAGQDASVGIGFPFARQGSFSDPGADTWTGTVDYGDGSGEQPLVLNADKTFSLTHVYAVAGDYTITISITDDDSGTGTDTVNVTVIVANDDSYSVDENTPLVVDGTALPGVMDNDTAPECEAILVTGVANGVLNFDSDGFFTYTPVQNYSGSDSFTYKVSNAQSESNVATVTITILDKTPPITTESRSPGPNSNGWNNTDVEVTLTATDNSSGVEEIHYIINDGTETVIPEASASVPLAEEGISDIAYFAVDNAGNAEAPKSLTVRIDKTSPTLVFGAVTPAPNAAGWNNTDVTITYTTDDNLSGVASSNPPSPLSFTEDGANQTQTVTVTNKAGNSETFASPIVNLDKTKPGITVNSPQFKEYLSSESITLV